VELQNLKQQQVNACKDATKPENHSSASSTSSILPSDSSKRTADHHVEKELPNKRPKRKCTVGTTVSYLEVDQDDNVKCIANHDAPCQIDIDEKDKPCHTEIDQVQTTTSLPETTTTVRLERKSFNLIGKKKKDLVQMCKQEGIDWSGSDTELKERIQRFADFWRAECDREEHKTREQVLAEFRRQEEIRKVEERRLNQSLEKKLVAKLNQSREAVGVGNSVKVTSGNVTFDKKTTRGFRKLISILGKQRNYESFHDMVAQVCARTSRDVPANLPNWKFDPDNEEDDGDDHENGDDEVVLVESSSSSHPSLVANPYHHSHYSCKSVSLQTRSPPQQQPSGPNANRGNLPTGSFTNQRMVASQPVQIVNPYHHYNQLQNTNHTTTTRQPHSSPQPLSNFNPYNAKVPNGSIPPNRPYPIHGQQRIPPSSQPLQYVNPYHQQQHRQTTTNPTPTHASPLASSWTNSNPYLPNKSAPSHVSTPTSTGGSKTATPITTRIVTDTKPPSTSGGNSIQPSKYKASQHQTVLDCNLENSQGTWTCEFCTFKNVIKKWSRSRRKCEVCQQVATKLS
jgi:hypothetical protein